MRGSVVKRGDGYSVVVELDRDPITSKRRQKWHSGYRTKRDAERALSEIVGSVHTGTYTEPTKQTLTDFVTDWLAAIEPTIPTIDAPFVRAESAAARPAASRFGAATSHRCGHAQRLVRRAAGRWEADDRERRGRRPVTTQRSLYPHDHSQSVS
jgi:hypothetical protein